MILRAVAAAALAFIATIAFLAGQSSPPHQGSNIEIFRPSPKLSGPVIEVIDGDTVRMNGIHYRLVGFDTPERGDKARCDDERRHADAATARLIDLIAAGDAHLVRVACACRPGEEGTRRCNYGRLCGSLKIAGHDVGQVLIREGLAHPYICGDSSCPRRQSWC
jgi:endonuclease YncB( thermonuclease family)